MYSKKIIDIWEGEYRVFFNFYSGKEKVTLGFPKRNNNISDVYVKINDIEQPRISFSEAKKYLTQGMINMISPRVKGLSSGYSSNPPRRIGPRGNSKKHTYGYCNKCGKKLRGDKSKDLCYECWSNS